MKMRLSDCMRAPAPDEGCANPLDESAMDRVRGMVLQGAGFQRAPAPRRGIGKRAMIVLAAALTLLLVLSTALATTSLGPKIFYMLRGYGGSESLLESLRLYGGAVGSEAEDQGITVRIEAAYANDAEGMLVLSFEDVDGRLDDGLRFHHTVSGWGVESDGSLHYQPMKGWDGRVIALLSMSGGRSLAGRNVLLSIDRIIPKTTYVSEQDTGLTLAEAMRTPMPFPMPGLPEAQVADMHFESGGLQISVEYPQNSRLQYAYLKLRHSTGEIVDSDWGQTIFPSDSEEMVRDERGFLNASEEDLRDCQLVVDYGVVDPAIEGKWELRFRMPREIGNRVEIPINRSVTVNGVDYLVESASVLPSCVLVRHSIGEWPEVNRMFDEDWAGYGLNFQLEANGVPVGSYESAWYVGEVNGRDQYQAVIYCLTEKQKSLTLEVLGEDTGEVLFEQKLK